ncbi:MAG: hypothetical protein ACRDYV_17450 [Acidimicrobiia bacterium]
MQRRRWTNPAQPQTLVMAVFLFYANAVLTTVFMVIGRVFPWVLVLYCVGQVVAAYGIANERKWGYWLGIFIAILPFGLNFLLTGNPIQDVPLLTLMFEIALVALLIHPQSRDYQRIWFK